MIIALIAFGVFCLFVTACGVVFIGWLEYREQLTDDALLCADQLADDRLAEAARWCGLHQPTADLLLDLAHGLPIDEAHAKWRRACAEWDPEKPNIPPQACRVCGCTNFDCTDCIARTGRPCSWIEVDLCSACVGTEVTAP